MQTNPSPFDVRYNAQGQIHIKSVGTSLMWRLTSAEAIALASDLLSIALTVVQAEHK